MRFPFSATMMAAVAGTMLSAGATVAYAGADDGGSKAFFDMRSAGSASGMPDTGPTARNPVAASQPNASVSRTAGVQDRANAERPSIASDEGLTDTPRPVRHRAAKRHTAP